MNFRILLSMFALLLFSSFPMYASFPVENAATNGSSQTTISQAAAKPTLSSPAAAGSGKSQSGGELPPPLTSLHCCRGS